MVRVRERVALFGGVAFAVLMCVGAAPAPNPAPGGWTDVGVELEMAAAEPRPLHIDAPLPPVTPLKGPSQPKAPAAFSDSPITDASEKVEKVLRKPFSFSFNRRRDQRMAASRPSERVEDQKPAAVDYYKQIEKLREEEKAKELGHKIDNEGVAPEPVVPVEELKESESEEIVVDDSKGEHAEPTEDKVNHEVEKEAAASKHHDHKHKGNNHHHAKGGGKSYHSEHHGSHGDKGDKGYKGHHHHEKGQKGHHKKENHNNHYEEKEGHDKEHHHDDGYHAQHEKGEEGKKGSKFHEEGEHSKGHSTKGEHNIRKTDEFEKKQEFYEESHEGGDFEKDGEFYHEDGYKKGGHEKGGHEHGGEEHSHHGKESKHEKGGHHQEDKGHKDAGGHDSHHDQHSTHGKKDSHSGGKRWHYHDGDDGDNDGKHSAQQIVIQPQNAQDAASTLLAVKQLLSPLLVFNNMDQSNVGAVKEESQHSTQYQLPQRDDSSTSRSDSFLEDEQPAFVETANKPKVFVPVRTTTSTEPPLTIKVIFPEDEQPTYTTKKTHQDTYQTERQPTYTSKKVHKTLDAFPQDVYSAIKSEIRDDLEQHNGPQLPDNSKDINSIIEEFKKENILPPDPPKREDLLEPKATDQNLDTKYDQYLSYIRDQAQQPTDEASSIREKYRHYKYIPPKPESLEAFTEASNQVKSVIQDPKSGGAIKQRPAGFKPLDSHKASSITIEAKEAPCPKNKDAPPDAHTSENNVQVIMAKVEPMQSASSLMKPIVVADLGDSDANNS
ncbi:unnamed protein product [Callosobruchus maculatus]|uniref:Uncharacterized protein n=1 Tax=Callosobruchus maculatus TaxID=64391 RepID=A0A653BSZ5_CALMS|nr:unnamed protein product [Callosobruchus maculatus]